MSLAEFCASGKDVVPFFRSMLAELASRGVSDYRLKLCPAPPPSSSFSVTVRPDNGQKHGPRQFAFCLSCDPEQATIAECNYQGGEKQRGPEGGLPERLRSLVRLFSERRNAEGLSIEIAIRQWARSDAGAASAVSRVDAVRLASVTELYARMGHDPATAQARGFIFYAFVFGQTLLLPEATQAARDALVTASADIIAETTALGR